MRHLSRLAALEHNGGGGAHHPVPFHIECILASLEQLQAHAPFAAACEAMSRAAKLWRPHQPDSEARRVEMEAATAEFNRTHDEAEKIIHGGATVYLCRAPHCHSWHSCGEESA
jgi:hypothetical protein